MLPSLTERERLIVALDFPDVCQALRCVDTLGDSVQIYKIGYQLCYTGGIDLARRLVTHHRKQVFLDLKLHDTPHTVANAVNAILDVGALFLTVHAYPQTMRAAVQARGNASSLKILAVTALTSCDQDDLAESGYSLSLQELISLKTKQALAIGVDGLILSPRDILPSQRSSTQRSFELICPGIRLPSQKSIIAEDQKRASSPYDAIRAGADRLVVGRPIVQDPDPAHAASSFLRAISSASSHT